MKQTVVLGALLTSIICLWGCTINSILSPVDSDSEEILRQSDPGETVMSPQATFVACQNEMEKEIFTDPTISTLREHYDQILQSPENQTEDEHKFLGYYFDLINEEAEYYTLSLVESYLDTTVTAEWFHVDKQTGNICRYDVAMDTCSDIETTEAYKEFFVQNCGDLSKSDAPAGNNLHGGEYF